MGKRLEQVAPKHRTSGTEGGRTEGPGTMVLEGTQVNDKLGNWRNIREYQFLQTGILELDKGCYPSLPATPEHGPDYSPASSKGHQPPGWVIRLSSVPPTPPPAPAEDSSELPLSMEGLGMRPGELRAWGWKGSSLLREPGNQ